MKFMGDENGLRNMCHNHSESLSLLFTDFTSLLWVVGMSEDNFYFCCLKMIVFITPGTVNCVFQAIRFPSDFDQTNTSSVC